MKHVLVAEDNPADRELIRLTFEAVDPSYRVTCVADGEELLAYLERENCASLTFVMLDLNMPRVSGTDVLVQLQQDMRYRTLPVIVFSSSVQASDVSRSYAEGANAYVRKPESFGDYQTTIQAITEFWGDTNILARPSSEHAYA